MSAMGALRTLSDVAATPYDIRGIEECEGVFGCQLEQVNLLLELNRPGGKG